MSVYLYAITIRRKSQQLLQPKLYSANILLTETQVMHSLFLVFSLRDDNAITSKPK